MDDILKKDYEEQIFLLKAENKCLHRIIKENPADQQAIITKLAEVCQATLKEIPPNSKWALKTMIEQALSFVPEKEGVK